MKFIEVEDSDSHKKKSSAKNDKSKKRKERDGEHIMESNFKKDK